MNGPGSIVRIWSANPKDAGNMRIYLDGSDKPVIEASLEKLLGGKWSTTIDGKEDAKETVPFPDPIACERSRGFNRISPIAYARHCKITIDRPNIYYHVDYRTYPAGTDVATFTWKEFARRSEQVNHVVETFRLEASRVDFGDLGAKELANGTTWSEPKDTLGPGQSLQLSFDGSRAIERFAVAGECRFCDWRPRSMAWSAFHRKFRSSRSAPDLLSVGRFFWIESGL